jgi:transposase-like protein
MVADQLRTTLPKLAALMDEAETDVLAYMAFPTAHRTKLRSVNPLERLNGEIKRRTDLVGLRGLTRASLTVLLAPQRGGHHAPRRRPAARAERRVGRPAGPLHDT